MKLCFKMEKYCTEEKTNFLANYFDLLLHKSSSMPVSGYEVRHFFRDLCESFQPFHDGTLKLKVWIQWKITTNSFFFKSLTFFSFLSNLVECQAASNTATKILFQKFRSNETMQNFLALLVFYGQYLKISYHIFLFTPRLQPPLPPCTTALLLLPFLERF